MSEFAGLILGLGGVADHLRGGITIETGMLGIQRKSH